MEDTLRHLMSDDKLSKFSSNNYAGSRNLNFLFFHKVIVSDYAAMDRVLREERAYILNIVKQVRKIYCIQNYLVLT